MLRVDHRPRNGLTHCNFQVVSVFKNRDWFKRQREDIWIYVDLNGNVEKLEGKSGRNTANWGQLGYQKKTPHRKLLQGGKWKMDAYCVLGDPLNIVMYLFGFFKKNMYNVVCNVSLKVCSTPHPIQILSPMMYIVAEEVIWKL